MKIHHAKQLAAIKTRRKGSRDDTLDNTLPRSQKLMHLKYNWKRAETMRVRENDVNADNLRLLTGIARNRVENALNAPVATAPKAFTALPRIAQLQDITTENQRLLKAIQNAKTKGLTREDFAKEIKRQKTALQQMRPSTTTFSSKKKLYNAAYKVVFTNMLARSGKACENGSPLEDRGGFGGFLDAAVLALGSENRDGNDRGSLEE